MQVLKEFSTPRRRFRAGADVVPSDLDGPLSVADWQRLGYLASDPAPPAAPRKSKPADADAAPTGDA
jgi:hypothetical protein